MPCKFILNGLLFVFIYLATSLAAHSQINNLEFNEPVSAPEYLGTNVNSPFAERLPIISPDGRTLYFARKYHPHNTGEDRNDDIWVSKLQNDGKWGKAVNLGAPLNNEKHNFVVSISPDGKTLYLANDYSRRNLKDGLSVSRWTSSGWSQPKSIRIENHYNKNPFVCYHVSVDEKILLMTVERSEGYGNRDMYVSFRFSDGQWSEPRNLGKVVNTRGMEDGVFLAADLKTLYFTSDGHPGYGGLDVFVTRRLDNSWERWSKPMNLGPKINRPGHDFSYSIPASGDYAYFSSDFEAIVEGMSNLYRIRLPEAARPEPVTLMKGRLIDAQTNQPIKGEESDFQIVVPSGKGHKSMPSTEGYYAVISNEESGQEEEEVDYDGDDPEILIQGMKPAKPDPALDRKRENLRKLQETISVLEEDRKTPVRTSVAENKPIRNSDNPRLDALKEKYAKLWEEPERPDNRNAISQNPENDSQNEIEDQEKIVQKPRPRTESPRLESKKDKYQQLFAEKEPPKEQEVQSEPEFENPIPEENTEEETEFENPAPAEEIEAPVEMTTEVQKVEEPAKPTKPASKPDKKLEDKMNKYAQLYNKPEVVPVEESEDINESSTPPSSLSSLEPVEQDPPIEEVESETVAFIEPVRENIVPVSEERDFQEMEIEIRSQIQKEVEDQIRNEYKDQLLEEVRNDLEEELEPGIRTNIEDELKEKVQEQLRSELEKEVREELEANLRPEVRDKLKSDLSPNIEQSLRDSLRSAMEQEIRDALMEEVQNQLKEELRESVKDDLRKEMEYRLKKEVELKLRREISDEIRKQAKERERDLQLAESSSENKEPEEEPEEYRELEQDIMLYPIKVGQIIPMNNIFFDANKTTLKEASQTELGRVLDFLENNTNLIVEISGHTNGLCSHEFAKELSDGRAMVVANYLSDRGIDPNRLTYLGYGKTQPIDSNDTVDGRKKNQRVEMKILEIR